DPDGPPQLSADTMERAEQCAACHRLAGSGLADHGDLLSGKHFQRDPIDHVLTCDADGDVLRFQERLRGDHPFLLCAMAPLTATRARPLTARNRDGKKAIHHAWLRTPRAS